VHRPSRENEEHLLVTPQFKLFAADAASEYIQFARLQGMSEWWHWMVLVAVCAAVLSYVIVMYRRDGIELSRGLSWGLVALRVLAFVGVLFFFLDMEKRSERRLVKNSRVLLLVDTSQSMGLTDEAASGTTSGKTRTDLVVEELSRGRLLPDLRKAHDLVVYRFDQSSRPVEVASIPKLPAEEEDAAEGSPAQVYARSLSEARMLAMIGGGLLFAGVFLALVYFLVMRPGESSGRTRAPGCCPRRCSPVIAGLVVVLAVGNLRNPDVRFLAMIGCRRAGIVTDAACRLRSDGRIGTGGQALEH
jgi:hypothetical protein